MTLMEVGRGGSVEAAVNFLAEEVDAQATCVMPRPEVGVVKLIQLA